MEIRNIPVGEVTTSPMNPRKTFSDEELRELADNIRQQGLLQPITVRPMMVAGPDGVREPANHGAVYEIVCGERRYRAVRLLNDENPERWATIASIVRDDMSDDEAFEAMIAENLQRKDVDPIEEAFAFYQLKCKGHSVEDIALRFGKSVRFIQDRIKLNSLIPELLLLVKEGKMAITAAMTIAKFDEETQRKFHGAYSGYQYIGKDIAQRFIGNAFMSISRAPWHETDQHFSGGCGCKCSECQHNTANANCLFWEMKEEGAGRCTHRTGFDAKHIAYLMSYLKGFGDQIVRKGETLGLGKIVIVDTVRWLNPEGQRMHDEVVKALKAEGYEIVNPFTTFSARIYSDATCEQMLKTGEAYRCIDVFTVEGIPDPSLCCYRVKESKDANGEVAPTEVGTLAAKHKRNIELREEGLAKSYSDMAKSVDLADKRGSLCPEEQTAFDMLVLQNLGGDFFQQRYQIGNGYARPQNDQLREIASTHPDDRDIWYREYLKKEISSNAYPGSLNSYVCRDVMRIWDKDGCEAVEQKAADALEKKNSKVATRLRELGYDTKGKKLPEEAAPKPPKPVDDVHGQYLEVKAKHPDTLPLFRVGDFYQTYEQDAADCADILGITPVTRTHGQDVIVMCGFPHHALDEYLPRLVRAGRRVAICEKD